MKRVYVTNSPEETEGIAAALTRGLKPGACIGLIGELGAGKTCFVKGVAKALGVAGYVKSPSFNIINIYEALPVPLYHIDLYRLSGPDELREAGLEDYIYGEGFSVIEWAEKAPGLLADCSLVVRISYKGETGRELEVEGG
ncbi:MAG: tRNA (adenosine(37)-N6)-threonylcarbamoyltransferase complex ATPase subunit type 1 TsaE [Deltaproteobacteria bacterium]|nr:tRNA (adenosine(37)-N6)-threonylcarbamoyltransferase complex ATPase subunit type 1 TsaE [Deltaproteobacteria bacterium]